MPKTLIVGCGYVGGALGRLLAEAGHDVVGTRRHPPGDEGAIRYVAADVLRPESLSNLGDGFDHAVYAVSAAGFTDEAYRDAYVTGVRNVLTYLHGHAPELQRFVFVGSSGVFHQNDGETVTEESVPAPSRFSGQRLLEGERAVAESGLPATVVRLSGIYGPGRTRQIDQVRHGDARRIRGAKSVLNHIHRDDCAGVLAHVLGRTEPAPLYLGTDCEPVYKNEALAWIADRLGVAPPPEVEDDGVAPKRGGHRFYDNRRLLDSGYEFLYPTYREGYGALIDAMRNR